MTEGSVATPLLLVIFGITGDLAQRYELPALYALERDGRLPSQTRIVGISRRDVSVADVYGGLRSALGDAEAYDTAIADRLQQHTTMCQMDLDDDAAYTQLLDQLKAQEQELGDQTQRVYYLSIPPDAFPGVVSRLGQTGHADAIPGHPSPRLLVEKPFGSDTNSAQQLLTLVARHFSEDQVYRIDHYVAKEMTQQLLAFRSSNQQYQRVWNNQAIQSVQIVAREELAIEGRAVFYDETGALRDFIQNHLLQLAAIVTMAMPQTADSDALHAAKLAALRAISPADPVQAVRGQYQGYREDAQQPHSTTETYAKLQLTIDADRWQNVPITLETGKALDERRTEIAVQFKPGQGLPDRLVCMAQPDEGLFELRSIHNAKVSDDISAPYRTELAGHPSGAYERIILDVLKGDHTLFSTADEVMRCWEIVQPVLDAWQATSDGLLPYAPGSTGPRN